AAVGVQRLVQHVHHRLAGLLGQFLQKPVRCLADPNGRCGHGVALPCLLFSIPVWAQIEIDQALWGGRAVISEPKKGRVTLLSYEKCYTSLSPFYPFRSVVYSPAGRRAALGSVTSHSRTVPSPLPETSVRPSGLNATANTSLVWPVSVPSRRPVPASH